MITTAAVILIAVVFTLVLRALARHYAPPSWPAPRRPAPLDLASTTASERRRALLLSTLNRTR